MIIPGFYAAARRSGASAGEPLTLGLNAYPYTGINLTRVVPAGCDLLGLKLWGGGGGGGSFNAGGGCGFTAISLPVVPGDVVLIQVGGSGGPGLQTPREGGAGGWPDGGDGAAGTNVYAGGGGGGSSRVYINGVLRAVAGGGGGGGYSGLGATGRGGGLVAGSEYLTVYNALGGSQTTGGRGDLASVPNNPESQGGYLRGGRAWKTGNRFTVQSETFTRGGGGGGGGYYGGGAANFTTNTQIVLGGGGSAYFPRWESLRLADGTAGGGTGASPSGTSDTDYPGAVGGGGAGGSNGNGARGGPGYVIVHAYPSDRKPVRNTMQTVEVVNHRGAAPVRTTMQTLETLLVLPSAPVRTTMQTLEIIRSVA
ncbi:putative lectin-like domain protein [Brevundimonas phage vB_BpoS-Papperlapapp]|uniref:Lectin-like domain protein n=2 Tax=Marchewkavirus TaxID=3425052 RepID=A0A9E7MR69_9CAUD|nr:putative lectin-like domain protein [Brevundimonas phage vB_BpoS-Kabachok]USN14921.1 putative lectin-like domain protein [Brevundimonas phage vB_BpoS-Domovoi]USN16294.1 putative lectin-like domain protein [Brevundimonas phage vB_BpoS-Papperlapapp]